MAGTGTATVAYYSDARYEGGAEKYIELLAGHLDRDRYAPAVIVAANETLEGFKARLKERGLPVHEAVGHPLSPGGFKSLSGILREVGPAILHMNLPGPFDSCYGLVAPASRMAGVKNVVATEHLPMVPSFARARLLRRLSGRFIDRVITVSSDNRSHLMRNHGVREDKIRVVYNGIPEPREAVPAESLERLRDGGERFVVLIVGSLEHRKGHSILFEAMRDLPSNVVLAVAGEGESEDEYRIKVRQLGLEERVSFLGFRDDVPSLMSAADLLAVPSVLDATPYTLLEALAAGLPVVASRVFGIPELVRHGVTGMLVEPGDSKALARTIRMIMEDRALMEKMSGESRRVFLSDFRIDRSVEATMAVYDELVIPGGTG